VIFSDSVTFRFTVSKRPIQMRFKNFNILARSGLHLFADSIRLPGGTLPPPPPATNWLQSDSGEALANDESEESVGWTMGFEPTTTGITKRRFAPCTLESQRLAIRKDVQRRVRSGHSTTKLPTVELVPAMRLHFRAAHEPRVAESGSRKAGRTICCATRLRSRRPSSERSRRWALSVSPAPVFLRSRGRT
jgi:hypothetical protein